MRSNAPLREESDKVNQRPMLVNGLIHPWGKNFSTPNTDSDKARAKRAWEHGHTLKHPPCGEHYASDFFGRKSGTTLFLTSYCLPYFYTIVDITACGYFRIKGAEQMHEALFYTIDNQETGEVRCTLCAHNCRIKDGRRGICGVRENRGGKLYSLVYGRLVSENIDPVEKKPLFHFHPASITWSIATVGCNFHCLHCQNYEISQYPVRHHGEITGRPRTAEEVVATAMAEGCDSISYTYIEPTIFMEFALDCAKLAKEAGLKNIFVSNGYTSEEATRTLAPFLDANNIDLKSFSDDFYRKVCGARLQPVLDTIRLMHDLGVWVEVTTLIIPGHNDSPRELEKIAAFIHGISPDIPWHVTRFYPTFKLTDPPPTPVATLQTAREIGKGVGLRHVYTGNIPGDDGENTFCPSCGELLIKRNGYIARQSGLVKGTCRNCGETIAGVWD